MFRLLRGYEIAASFFDCARLNRALYPWRLRRLPCSLLILGRGNAGDLFIYAGEMGRGLEAEVVRRGGDTVAGTELFVGAADDKLMDETDGGIACRFARQVV